MIFSIYSILESKAVLRLYGKLVWSGKTRFLAEVQDNCSPSRFLEVANLFSKKGGYYQNQIFERHQLQGFMESRLHTVAQVVFLEVDLPDLPNDNVAFKKCKLITRDTQGEILTTFHEKDLTDDQIGSMVKKQSIHDKIGTSVVICWFYQEVNQNCEIHMLIASRFHRS